MSPEPEPLPKVTTGVLVHRGDGMLPPDARTKTIPCGIPEELLKIVQNKLRDSQIVVITVAVDGEEPIRETLGVFNAD